MGRNGDCTIGNRHGHKCTTWNEGPSGKSKDRSSRKIHFLSHLGMGLDEKSTICSAWHPLMFSGMSGMSGREEGGRDRKAVNCVSRCREQRRRQLQDRRRIADATAELNGVKKAGAKRKCTF